MNHLPPYLPQDQRMQLPNVNNNNTNTDNNNNRNNSSSSSSNNVKNNGAENKSKRGRPPGSKNKSKAPLVIRRESGNAVRVHVMEVPTGHDVVESISQFVRRRMVDIMVTSGCGTVACASIRSPTGSTLQLRGPFEIVSLSGSMLSPPSLAATACLTVHLANGHGQMAGGAAVGPLVALGPVMVTAFSFDNAYLERLPLIPEEQPPERSGTQFQVPPILPPPPPQPLLGGVGSIDTAPLFHGQLTEPVNDDFQLPTDKDLEILEGELRSLI
ncbi:AT-hook motif nuclear-localized protein 18-like [Zingiber officinale]|uniref:AT-hook motif nuclear-localized protein 18-like n=1 Tax=Zingiber officinale TaxID=94328 RepID=UPI001C4D0A56|nr:AT-hook motif nuclear-localized protein 18-like [Zingiber officinale]